MMLEDHDIDRLRRLFLEQTEKFRNLVQTDDRKARFRMTFSLPDDGKNWFIWFNPSLWGRASSAGIHWALISTQRSKRPSGILHLALGVEDLRKPHADEFKQLVVSDAHAKGVVPVSFRLFDQDTKQKKLLVSPSISLDKSTAKKFNTLYKEVQQFNVVVSHAIRKFDRAGYFAHSLEYI